MKHRNISISLILTIVALFGAAQIATAATITFRGEPVECRGTTVTLGDVAAVTPDRDESPDAIERLKKIVLFPAPIAGKDRTITYREIYDYLKMRGVPVDSHAFAGASQVTVTTAPTVPRQSRNPSGNATSFVRRQTQEENMGHVADESEELVRHAVLGFFEQNVAVGIPWRVDVKLSEEGKRRVMTYDGVNGIRSAFEENRASQNASRYDPAEAWLGRQRFELQLNAIAPETGMHRTMFVEVDVSLPKAIVVTRHAVAKGKVLGAADVKLRYLTDVQTPSNVTKERTVNGVTTRRNREPEIDPEVATRIEDVVGKAVLRTLRNDVPVLISQIETPFLVKKSDIVTLFVRNGGITIKMTARSKEDGKAGDLITVESLSDKQTSLARVVDYGVVEVEMMRSETTAAQLARSNRYGN